MKFKIQLGILKKGEGESKIEHHFNLIVSVLKVRKSARHFYNLFRYLFNLN